MRIIYDLYRMTLDEHLAAKPHRGPQGASRKDELLISRIVFPFPALM